MQTFFIFYHGFNHVVFHVIVARPGWSGEVICRRPCVLCNVVGVNG